MNSYLLHGENHPESRKKLSEIIDQAKGQAWEVIKVEGLKDKVDPSLLSRSQSILGGGQYFVIENYFSGARKAPQTVKELFTNLDSTVAFIFWESKSIPYQTARALEKYLSVIEYKIPKTLFNFLNSFSPGNTESALKSLQYAKRENPPDMLLIMLSRQVRMLYLALVDPKGLKVPDWQKRNLVLQSKKFTPAQLLYLHHQLLELDRKNKKSQLPEDLGSSLDLLVTSL